MKHVFNLPQLALVAGLLGIVAICSSWQLSQKSNSANHSYSANGDTSEPRLQHDDAYQFDMKEFNKQMDDLNEQLKKINFGEINKQIHQALSQIDFNKISQDFESSIKKIDWDKIKVDVNRSLRDANEQIKKIDTEKIHEQLKEMQNKLNSEKFRSQIDSEKIHQQINEAIKKAKEGIEKAKQK